MRIDTRKALPAVTVGRKWAVPLSRRRQETPNGGGSHGCATPETSSDMRFCSVPPVGLEPTLDGFKSASTRPCTFVNVPTPSPTSAFSPLASARVLGCRQCVLIGRHRRQVGEAARIPVADHPGLLSLANSAERWCASPRSNRGWWIPNCRISVISPGVTESELAESISDGRARVAMRGMASSRSHSVGARLPACL
jgi:hypothetical protein